MVKCIYFLKKCDRAVALVYFVGIFITRKFPTLKFTIIKLSFS